MPEETLESWVQELNAGGSKSEWVAEVFRAMKADPSDPAYVKPQKGDVWNFIESLARWIDDPRRKGIPE